MQHRIGTLAELLKKRGQVVKFIDHCNCTTYQYGQVSYEVPVIGGFGQVLQMEVKRHSGGTQQTVHLIDQRFFDKHLFYLASPSEVRGKKWSSAVGT
jgi:hypothetical protein